MIFIWVRREPLLQSLSEPSITEECPGRSSGFWVETEVENQVLIKGSPNPNSAPPRVRLFPEVISLVSVSGTPFCYSSPPLEDLGITPFSLSICGKYPSTHLKHMCESHLETGHGDTPL